ncbi:MAG: hypothetical protein Q4D51_03895 [Eubacteriales bacterium]|nr:hypothetical protein [Eubacteriales bacterium]
MRKKMRMMGLIAVYVAALCGCNKKIESDVTEVTTQIVTEEASEEKTEETQITTEQEETNVPVEEKDYNAIYKRVLDQYYALILSNPEDFDCEVGELGVVEAVMGKDINEALGSVGYAIEDISGDGVPELLVGEIEKMDGDMGYGSLIDAIYTCVEDAPVLVADGHSRSQFFAMDTGSFYYLGSNGAMYTLFGQSDIIPDGTALKCKDFYFTYEKDDTFTEIGYYYNQIGISDKEQSEELNISEAEFWKLEEDLESQIKQIAMTPFSMYADSEENVQATGVSVQWARDIMDTISEYDEFVDGDAQTKIVISTDKTVTEVKVLALQFEDADEEGNISFAKTQLYEQKQLTKERPLVIGVTFVGDIPNYGISYVDESGNTQTFAIQESGMDGSLMLVEFK